MTDGILVLNAGSSSIKFAVFAAKDTDGFAPVRRGLAEGLGGPKPRFMARDGNGRVLADDSLTDASHGTALARVLADIDGAGDLPPIRGVGHRVVHGGVDFSAPVRITPTVIDNLAALERLAPLHQPHNVAAIRAIAHARPDLPQVACFDTAFHATQPEVARQTGLPHRYWERGIRRYGFHGLSYESVVEAFPRVARRPLPDRVVIAHLGNGASMCAVEEGRSIATTMGFSTVDGIPMGTRSGAVDPGALVFVAQEEGLDIPGLTRLLYEGSGLRGISGVGSDMRALLASDVREAHEAIDYFCYRIGRELGSLSAALHGLDALIFTGGIGENAALVRRIVCSDAAWLGLAFDEKANEAGGPMITQPRSRVSAWVIPSEEDRIIARHTRRLLAQPCVGAGGA